MILSAVAMIAVALAADSTTQSAMADMDFVLGTWQCSSKSMTNKMTFSRDLDGHAIIVHSVQTSPSSAVSGLVWPATQGPDQDVELWGYSLLGKKYTAAVQTDADLLTFTSPGWIKGSLAWSTTGAPLLSQRDVYTKTADTVFTVVSSVGPTLKQLVEVDRAVCRKI